jgi:hypothetical protein
VTVAVHDFWAELHEALVWMIHYSQLSEVTLSRAEFDALYEYSTSRPTGVYPNKRWKRNERHIHRDANQDIWILGEYLPSRTRDPDRYCELRWSRILVEK